MSDEESVQEGATGGKVDEDRFLRRGNERRGSESRSERRFLGEEELPAQVEQDLIDLSNKKFEKEYGVDSTAPGETLIQAADVFDLPNMSDERLEALQDGLAQMSSERVIQIQERIIRPPVPDSSALALARQHVLDVLVAPVDPSAAQGSEQASREKLMHALENLRTIREAREAEPGPGHRDA